MLLLGKRQARAATLRDGRLSLLGLAALSLAACVGTVSPAGTGTGGATTAGTGTGGGASATGGASAAAGRSGQTGSGGRSATGGTGVSTGGSGVSTGGTTISTGGAGGRGVSTGGAAASTGGVGGATAAQSVDHCTYGFTADSRDTQITDTPDQWTSPMNGAIDLVLPGGVLAWMHESVWEQSHDAWHDIRRCKNGATQTSYGVNVCSHTELVPAHQECTDAEDGYEFLVMHRHMMQALRQSFPQHTDLFQGFPKFPFNATDVPQQWQGRWGSGWSQQIIATATTLEAIESNVAMFPTEGDLGKYIQCGGMANGASSIHGALHFKWVVNDSPYSLGSQPVNIDNYMFWKLHGWIDQIWERYRVATGLADTEPKLVQALHDQCVQMHALGQLFNPNVGEPTDTTPLPVEHGYFVDNVRPIFEQVCSGCHGETSPEASMSLGGHISNADIVAGLVNATTSYGGQFKRIVPNSTSTSWLYLKVSGTAMNAGCTGSDCNAEVMPPTGQVTLSPGQLNIIATWINMGAPAPTQ